MSIAIAPLFAAVLGLTLAPGARPASAQTANCPVTDPVGIKGSVVNINFLPAQPLNDGAFVRWAGPDFDAYSDVRADLEEGGRVVISAELATARGRTSQITAVLIGLVAPGAPGFMDYTDDACIIADGRLTFGEVKAACADLRSAFRSYVDVRRRAFSLNAVIAQDQCGIVMWNPQ